MSTTSLSPRICTVSLIGNREEQQDSYGVWKDDDGWLAVVADGAGGHLGGAKASKIATDLLGELWASREGDLRDEVEISLMKCLLVAHHRIIEETGKGDPQKSGKAAIVVVYCRDAKFWIAHVGDCRCYHLQGDRVLSKTTDDSLLQLLLDLGRISADEAHGHPGQSRLMQALGTQDEPKVHLTEQAVLPESVILLCCDGFWNELSTEDILGLTQCVEDDTCCLSLKKLANRAIANAQGKSDNVTAIACFIP